MAPHPTHLTLLLLGAALLAVMPADAHAGLLPTGARPPVFVLPDGTGKAVALRSFLGPRRIVLLFGPAAPYLETVRAERARFEERDLAVLAVVPPDSPLLTTPHPGPVHTLRDAGNAVAQQYGAAGGGPVFYLVGKDGHVALARRGYPTTRELFGVIDAMPMRRQEMRDRRR